MKRRKFIRTTTAGAIGLSSIVGVTNCSKDDEIEKPDNIIDEGKDTTKNTNNDTTQVNEPDTLNNVTDTTQITDNDSLQINDPDTTQITDPDTTQISDPDTTQITDPDTTQINDPDTVNVNPGDTTQVTEPDIIHTDGVPQRILGKTGLAVSMLAFGGGSQFMKNKNGDWEEILEYAIDKGVNYFDTSYDYLDATGTVYSEERYGQVLKKYRDDIFITTKLNPTPISKIESTLDASLKRLQTDHVDGYFIHAVDGSDNIDSLGKMLYKMQELKEAGKIRFVGFSSMDSAQASASLIESYHDIIDVALIAMNPTRYGNYDTVTLPLAKDFNIGVLLMKVFRDIVGVKASPEELLTYGLDLDGVATAIVGHYGLDKLKENISIVKDAYSPGKSFWKRQRNHDALERRLKSSAGPHALCWARSDYRDGIDR